MVGDDIRFIPTAQPMQRWRVRAADVTFVANRRMRPDRVIRRDGTEWFEETDPNKLSSMPFRKYGRRTKGGKQFRGRDYSEAVGRRLVGLVDAAIRSRGTR